MRRVRCSDPPQATIELLVCQKAKIAAASRNELTVQLARRP